MFNLFGKKENVEMKEAEEKEVKMKEMKKVFSVGTEIYREDDDYSNKLEEGVIIQILDFEECQCNPFQKPTLQLKVIVKTTEGIFKENVSDLILKEKIKKPKKK